MRESLCCLKQPAPGAPAENFYRLIRDADAIGYDFVAFADQDDTWYADKLERACAALHRAGAGGYSSAVRAVYADGRTHLLRQSPRTTSVDFLFEGAGQGCTFVMTRELFCRAQGAVRGTWDEVCQVHHHDWMLYALCRSWKLGWYFDPVPSMDYRQHSGNELGGRGSFAGISKRWGMLRSGWYLKQVDAVAGVIVGTGGAASIADFLQRRPPTHTLSKRAIWVTMLLRVGRRKPADRLVLGVAALLGYV